MHELQFNKMLQVDLLECLFTCGETHTASELVGNLLPSNEVEMQYTVLQKSLVMLYPLYQIHIGLGEKVTLYLTNNVYLIRASDLYCLRGVSETFRTPSMEGSSGAPLLTAFLNQDLSDRKPSTPKFIMKGIIALSINISVVPNLTVAVSNAD